MHWFTFIVLSIIFIVSPYSKGLYFMADFYGVSLIIVILSVIVLLRIFLYKEPWNVKMMAIVFLLPLSYILPLPISVSVQEAGETAIRWITYAVFFFILYWATTKEEIRKWMPIVFQITGVWISIYMLFVSLGWLSSKGLYVSERFAGVLQYPNTYAMITGVFYLFSLVMMTQLQWTWRRLTIYSLPLITFLVCFIQTYSRGMLLVLPVAWFAGLLLLSARKQVEYILFSFISIGFSLSILQVNPSSTGTFVFLLLSLSSLNLALVFIIKKYSYMVRILKLETWFLGKWLRFLIPLIITFISLLALLDLKNQGLIYRSLPTEFQDRISSISLQASTAKERFIFLEDAFQISQESPLIGHGGGSWKTLYKTFQQGPYLSNKIHNGYMEWLVDTGWIGLILFIFVFGFYLYQIVLAILKDKETTVRLAVIPGLLIVFAHSFIDFNFSYGTVWLIVFWLLAMGLSRGEGIINHGGTLVLTKISLVILAGSILMNGFFSYKYLQAAKYFHKAKGAETVESKRGLLEQAVNLYPQNTTYLSNLIDMELKLGKNKQEDKAQLIARVDQLVDAAPRNSNIILKAALVSEEIGESEQAFDLYQRALELDHFNSKIYEGSMKFKNMMLLTNPFNKEFYATSVIEDYEEVLKWEKVVMDSKLPEQFNSRDFKVTSNINYQAGISYFILEKYERVVELYESDIEKPMNLSALCILAYENLGDVGEVEKILAVSQDPNKLTDTKNKLGEILLK
jgi:tetratricopeptide (TPR) repeat protein